jgi:hypothetical protein
VAEVNDEFYALSDTDAERLALVRSTTAERKNPVVTGWTPVDLGRPEYGRPSEPPITLGLLYRGRRHAFTGPPEAAKTVLALIGGLEHSRGGEGRFALVDFEMGEQATRLMLEELGATADEIAAVYYVAPDGPPTEDDAAAVAAAGVTLVIVDAAAGAYDVSGLDDMKRADAEKFSRGWIRPLWERGVATVLLDHVTKNPDTRGRFAIGSECKLGTADVKLGLEAVTQLSRGGTGLIRISTDKDRPGHLSRPRAAELELRSDPETHRITWTLRKPSETGEEWRPTALRGTVAQGMVLLPDPSYPAAVRVWWQFRCDNSHVWEIVADDSPEPPPEATRCPIDGEEAGRPRVCRPPTESE